MKIKVKRAYLVRGVRFEVGTVLEVSDAFGRELIAGDKAERTDEPLTSEGPMTTESATALVAGAGSGEPAKTDPDPTQKAGDGKAKEKSNAGK